MPEVNRRRFLHIAGATGTLTALCSSIQRAAALPAHHRTGSLEDVEYIVVLMQENRSFDHYFGSLAGVRRFGDPRPVTRNGGPCGSSLTVRRTSSLLTVRRTSSLSIRTPTTWGSPSSWTCRTAGTTASPP